MGNPRKRNGGRRRATVSWLKAQRRSCWMCGIGIDYSLPAGPLSFNCDEIVPVSRGGSPYDHDNVDAAHACCNQWRKARPAQEVQAVRAQVLARFGAWSSPLQFVALCKALKAQRPPTAAPATAKVDAAPMSTSTDW